MAVANLGRVSFVPKGNYDPSLAYERLAVVNYNNATYMSMTSVPAGNPPPDETYWMPLLAISSGGGGAYVLPIASASQLGGVQPYNKTEDMTLPVGVDENGALWFEKPVYTAIDIGAIPSTGRNVQSANLALGAVTTDILADQAVTAAKIANGVIPPAYTLPIATPAVLGGVKPVAATADMTQVVGVDANGALYVDAYSKATIDASLGSYITDIDALVGGDA